MSLSNCYTIELTIGKECAVKRFDVSFPGFSGHVLKQSIERDMLFEKKKKYLSIEVPAPSQATCLWTSANGLTNSTIIPVRSLLPLSFRSQRDTLIFTLTPSNSVDFAVGIWNGKYSERRIPVACFPAVENVAK
jgi:hypothetical protein